MRLLYVSPANAKTRCQHNAAIFLPYVQLTAASRNGECADKTYGLRKQEQSDWLTCTSNAIIWVAQWLARCLLVALQAGTTRLFCRACPYVFNIDKKVFLLPVHFCPCVALGTGQLMSLTAIMLGCPGIVPPAWCTFVSCIFYFANILLPNEYPDILTANRSTPESRIQMAHILDSNGTYSWTHSWPSLKCQICTSVVFEREAET